MVKRTLQVIIGIFGIIVLFEGLLQLLSLTLNPWRNFDHFLEKKISDVLKRVNKSPTKKHLFFVGDSHIYGLGATRPELGLVGQFLSLASDEIQDLECHNLGYPGTSSLDHLEVLKRIPKRSVIILRTGANNLLDTRLERVFTQLWPTLELKTIKLFRFLMAKEKSKLAQQEIFSRIWQLTEDRQFDLILMGYTYKKSLAEDYFNTKGVVLSPLDFLAKHKQDTLKYLSYNGRHPNDMGYSLEATLLLHYFQTRGLWSSSKNLQNFEPSIQSLNLWYPWLNSEIQSLKANLISHENPACLDLRHLLSLTYELSLLGAKYKTERDYHDLITLLVLGCNDQLIARETLDAIENHRPLPLGDVQGIKTQLKAYLDVVSEGLLANPQKIDQCLPEELRKRSPMRLEKSWEKLIRLYKGDDPDVCNQISLKSSGLKSN